MKLDSKYLSLVVILTLFGALHTGSYASDSEESLEDYLEIDPDGNDQKKSPVKQPVVFWLDHWLKRELTGKIQTGFILNGAENPKEPPAIQNEKCRLKVGPLERDFANRMYREVTFESNFIKDRAISRNLFGPTRAFLPFERHRILQNLTPPAPKVNGENGAIVPVLRYAVLLGDGSHAIFNVVSETDVHSVDWVQLSDDAFNNNGFQVRCALDEIAKENPQTAAP
jgi:hypothetical protein